MPVQDFSISCSIRRRQQHAVSSASAECGYRSSRFRSAIYGLSITLLCGCTPQLEDMEPFASNPPKTLQSAYPANQTLPTPLHRRAAEKRWLRKPRRIKQLENVAGIKQLESLAAIEPSALIGKEPSAVRKLLGSPADISEKDVSLVWTYGSPQCAFQVYFYPDIKTLMFHALQYAATTHDGGKIDLSQGCVQRLLVMRK